MRTIDCDVEIAIEHVAELDVGEGEIIPGEKGVARDLVLGDVEFLAEDTDGVADRGVVAMLRRGTHHAPEDRSREMERDVDLGPFGPFVDVGATLQLLRPERRVTVTVAEIAQDGAGLPERFAVAVPQDRHGAARIHRQKFRRVLTAVFVADVMAPEGEPQLADAPHQRLDVGRGLATPDRQHGRLLPVRQSRESLDGIGGRENLSPFAKGFGMAEAELEWDDSWFDRFVRGLRSPLPAGERRTERADGPTQSKFIVL
jgi:hypothetical protein